MQKENREQSLQMRALQEGAESAHPWARLENRNKNINKTSSNHGNSSSNKKALETSSELYGGEYAC